jgi:hypothetical protein
VTLVGGGKMALRSTPAPIRDSELDREICAVLGCRPRTMSLIEYFDLRPFDVCISEGDQDQLVPNRQSGFGEADYRVLSPPWFNCRWVQYSPPSDSTHHLT